MAKTSCPNGHGMWDGRDSLVWVFHTGFFYDYMKNYPSFVLGGVMGEIYDCVACYPEEKEYDCWYCEECRALVIFVDTDRYEYLRMKEPPDISFEEARDWEEYIALHNSEMDDFMEFYEGKTAVWAIENYPFKFKCRVSPDQKTIVAFDVDGNVQFGYQQYRILDLSEALAKR